MQQIPRQHATTTNLHILALNLIDGRNLITAFKFPRHKVRVNHMIVTSGPLELDGWYFAIPSVAVPGAISERGGMGAGSAIHLFGGVVVVAEIMGITVTALIPRWIGVQGFRHSI
jgi:hypothetical protein